MSSSFINTKVNINIIHKINFFFFEIMFLVVELLLYLGSGIDFENNHGTSTLNLFYMGYIGCLIELILMAQIRHQSSSTLQKKILKFIVYMGCYIGYLIIVWWPKLCIQGLVPLHKPVILFSMQVLAHNLSRWVTHNI